MTDPQRPLTRREARELRRAQEAAAQGFSAPVEQATAAQPAEEATEPPNQRRGRRSAGPTPSGTLFVPKPAVQADSPQQSEPEDSSSSRQHGRRRGTGPVDGGSTRQPQIHPAQTPPSHAGTHPEPVEPEDFPAVVVPSPAQPSPASVEEDDDATQLGLPPVVPQGSTAEGHASTKTPRSEPERPAKAQPKASSAPAPASQPSVKSQPEPEVEPVRPPTPTAPAPQEAQQATPIVSPPEPAGASPAPAPSTPQTKRRKGQSRPPRKRGGQDPAIQAALSGAEPRSLDVDQLAEIDRDRQRSVREAMGRSHQPPVGSAPSFSEILGIGKPAPTGHKLAPAVAPLDSPEQHDLENTGLVAPVTSRVPIVLPTQTKDSALEQDAKPLQAREAHGLDPLEYRVSGVNRTRAGLAVVVGSVVVAVAAVVLAFNL